MAALALDNSPHPDTAVPALTTALHRLGVEGRQNSLDARKALVDTLTHLGAQMADRRCSFETADDGMRLGV